MARYLVTGGCGFIGSHLADALLAEGHDVRILDNLSTGHRENAPEASELMIGDVADHQFGGFRGVFPMAGRKIVEDADVVAFGKERIGEVRSDEAAAAGDQISRHEKSRNEGRRRG